MSVKISEPTLNIVLAQLFVKRELKALGEAIIHGRKQPDVLLSIYGIKIIVEGKYFQQSVRTLLEEQCHERIDQGLCEICVSIIYPKSLFDHLLNPTMTDVEQILRQADLDYNISLISKVGISETGWSSAKVDLIANIIRSSYTSVVTEDIVGSAAESLNSTLDNSVSEISLYGIDLNKLGTRIKDAIGLPEDILSQKTEAENDKSSE